MTTPFDRVIDHIRSVGYHNQRREDHSDIVSEGIFADIQASCPYFSRDLDAELLTKRLNVEAPGDRKRNIDLYVAEKSPDGSRDKVRICVENKSVVTAHRNATNRFDDLTKILGSVYSVRPEAIIVATVMVGVSTHYLNVADRIRAYVSDDEFERVLRPRLSTGDTALLRDYPAAVSKNRDSDFTRTIAKFRQLPLREPGTTHVRGFDFLLLIPVAIDNVNPARIARDNPFGIDVDASYRTMIDRICAAYRARWHSMES